MTGISGAGLSGTTTSLLISSVVIFCCSPCGFVLRLTAGGGDFVDGGAGWVTDLICGGDRFECVKDLMCVVGDGSGWMGEDLMCTVDGLLTILVFMETVSPGDFCVFVLLGGGFPNTTLGGDEGGVVVLTLPSFPRDDPLFVKNEPPCVFPACAFLALVLDCEDAVVVDVVVDEISPDLGTDGFKCVIGGDVAFWLIIDGDVGLGSGDVIFSLCTELPVGGGGAGREGGGRLTTDEELF